MMAAHTQDSALYLFLHQYKTAGTTLWRHLTPNFPGEAQLFLSGERVGLGTSKRDGHPAVPGFVRTRVDEYVAQQSHAGTRLLMGHFVYPGIHTLVPGARHPRYLMCLRHPVERVVSLYWYLKHGSDSYWHDEIVQANWSLDEWLDGTQALWARNGQTRHLLIGGHEQACLARDLNPALLPEALAALDRFWFVGLTETFERDSAYVLGHIGATRFAKKNAIRVNKHKEPTSPETYARIAAANQLDMELYEHALRQRAAFVRRHAISYFWLSSRATARKRAWQDAAAAKERR